MVLSLASLQSSPAPSKPKIFPSFPAPERGYASALAAANRFLAPTRQTIQYLEPEGDVMTPTDEPTEDNKASWMMRRAILHELLRPFDPDPPPPVDMLQAVSRAIVVKAWQGDMTAAKEILDRIDGKTLTAVAPASAEIPNEVFFTWQRP